VPYLSALDAVHDEALYKSTFTFTFSIYKKFCAYGYALNINLYTVFVIMTVFFQGHSRSKTLSIISQCWIPSVRWENVQQKLNS